MTTDSGDNKTRDELIDEIEQLRFRLEEAEQTLEAIRTGDVDALVVSGPHGDQIFSLTGAESTYRLIYETMNEGALTVSIDGTILFCNRRFCELMKSPMEDCIGSKLARFVAPAQLQLVQSLIADAGSGPFQRLCTLRAADGSAVSMQLAGSTISNGVDMNICLLATDLTELELQAGSIATMNKQQLTLEEKQAELEEANASLRNSRLAALNLMQDAVDTRHQLEESTISLQRAHDDLDQRIRERTADLETAVDILQVEIAERKKAEQELERSAHEVEDLYNLAPCGYHSLDKDGMFVRINDTELNWLGYERHEIVDRLKFSDLLTPESLAVFADRFPRFKQGSDISDQRFNFVRKDGSILPVLLNATPIMADNGDYIMSRSTIYDITELSQAEESIRRLNRLYLTLSETGKAIARFPGRAELFQQICRITVEQGGFRMVWVSLLDEESKQILPVASFGYGTDYLENIRISARSDAEGMGPTGTVVRFGGHYICNDYMTDPRTGPWRSKALQRGFLSSAAFAISLNGGVIGAITIYAAEKNYFDAQIVELLKQMQSDISFALDNLERETRRREAEFALQAEITERLDVMKELRQKEQMLLQQSRLAAMGEMINNIAHQWRQPLNTLGLIIQKLPLFYDTDAFNREFLEENCVNSMKQIQHMSQTINDFRDFFRTDKEMVLFSLDAVTRQAVAFVDQTFKDLKIKIDLHADEVLMVRGYPNEFAQALLNILMNARDALVWNNTADPRIILRTFKHGDSSVVTVTDNGGGIPGEVIDRVFDPYFTTKGPDKGTGLGLFMSKAIIEKNIAGRLTVRNTGNGAEFRIEVAHDNK